MRRLRYGIRRIHRPPLWAVPWIVVPCFILLGYCLATRRADALAHAADLLSTYALVTTVVAAVRVAGLLRRRLRRSLLHAFLRGIPLVRLLMDDVVFRTRITLILSMGLNLLYAAAKLAMGIAYRSVWFTTLGLYYLALAFLRHMILRSDRVSPIGVSRTADLRRSRLCGIILLLMNQLLLGVVVQAVYSDGVFDYPGPLIYGMAFYAFFAVANAVVKLHRFRRANSPLLAAAKAVSLTAAMVSMLSLEIAMTVRFGTDAPEFRRRMTASLGGVICAVELIMAVAIIVGATRALRRAEA